MRIRLNCLETSRVTFLPFHTHRHSVCATLLAETTIVINVLHVFDSHVWDCCRRFVERIVNSLMKQLDIDTQTGVTMREKYRWKSPWKSYVVTDDVVELSTNQNVSCSITLISVHSPSADVLKFSARKNSVFPSDIATYTWHQAIIAASKNLLLPPPPVKSSKQCLVNACQFSGCD